jgi:two-component system, chemotaxis family, CheB/CheR fusion protein
MKDAVGLKLLLVDDEPAILGTMRLILQSEGFEVETASCGNDAKDALTHTAFDVVLTDLCMESDTAGYEIVRLAQAQPKKPVTVVVSGFPDLLETWQQEGADAGLQKPTDVPELLATIHRLVANRLLK